MSQAPSEGDPLSSSHGHGDPNFSALYSLPIFPAAGGWEQQQLASLPWLENVGVPGLRRRVLPPNAAAAASAPLSGMYSGALDSDRSFTDMITRGCNPAALSDNVPPRNETPASDDAPASVKGNQKRTKNFSVEEDEMLVSAWLNVSLDPVHGVDQSRSTYWKRIYDYFHGNKTFDSDRTQSSLMSRWSGIQHDVNIFAGCVSKIEARNQSGLSIDDKQTNTLRMFKAEDKQHRNFPYIHCWKILKDQPKWMNRSNQSGTQKLASKKQKTTTNSSPATAAQLVVNTNGDDNQAAMPTLDRPTGKKKEKDKLRQRSSIEALDYLLAKKKEADTEKDLKKEERCKKAFALQEERIRIEEERIRIEKEKFEFKRNLKEERIMNVDTSTMSTKQQLFYDQLQNDILARRLKN